MCKNCTRPMAKFNGRSKAVVQGAAVVGRVGEERAAAVGLDEFRHVPPAVGMTRKRTSGNDAKKCHVHFAQTIGRGAAFGIGRRHGEGQQRAAWEVGRLLRNELCLSSDDSGASWSFIIGDSLSTDVKVALASMLISLTRPVETESALGKDFLNEETL